MLTRLTPVATLHRIYKMWMGRGLSPTLYIFCWPGAKCYEVFSVLLARDNWCMMIVITGCAIRSVTRGARGRTSPGAESLWKHRITAGLRKAQKCHKYFLQYSTLASERPQVRTWGGAELASCPGRHLTSVRPNAQCMSIATWILSHKQGG